MSRVKLFAIVVVAAALLAVPMFAFASAPAQTSGPLTVTLNTLNNSGQTGTATLTDAGNGQTKVDVTINGEPTGADEPMHIHNGSCTNLGSIKYPLNDVIDGKSSTTINASLDSLQTGNLAINGHKSKTDMTTYIFCGEIPAAAAASTTATTTTAATAAATTAATAVATTAATAAPTVAPTATTAPVSSAATPATTSTVTPGTLPTTGGSDPGTLLLPAFVLAMLALSAGYFLRRLATK